MKVSVAIMACKEREAYVTDTLERLDAPATVVWDQKRDRYDTGRRALLAYDPDATHHLVLQDDALVCRDLVASLHEAVEVIPNNPLCLYFGHGRNGAHQRTNRLASIAPVPCMLVFEGPWWGVAVCFPVALIERMLKTSDGPQSTPAYDKRLSRALIKMGTDTYYVLPSLVDHRLDGPSMIEGREQDDRHAHHFIGQDASALDVDWSSLPVLDGHRHAAKAKVLQTVRAPRTKALRPRPRPESLSTVSVAVAVMAHPKREGFVTELTEKLDAPATVVYDTKNDRWDTGRRSMLAYRDSGATHWLVIQDDAVLPRDLVAGLTKAAEVISDNPIGCYVGTIRPATHLMSAMVTHAQTTQASWVVGEGPWWGVGVMVPVTMIEAMIAWCDRQKIAAYDRRMAAYFKQAGIDCFYTMPSLLDHRHGPSLVTRNASASRRARWFIGEENSALDIDWTRLPELTGQPFVTYQGPGARRFHRCLSCDYYTPNLSSMHTHLASCGLSPLASMTSFRNAKTSQTVRLRADSANAQRYRERVGWVEEVV